MAEGFINTIRDGKHLSISDYKEAYDNDVAFEEASYIDTSLITSIPTDDFFRKFKNLRYIRLPNVTDLPSNAFSGCTKLEKVFFPKVSILSNTGIFSGCTNLSQVQFANNLEIKSTASYLFHNCYKLNNIMNAICNDVFPYAAFNFCSEITAFTINGSCYSINTDAFEGCNKLNFIAAKYVTNIGHYAFANCAKLISFQFSSQLSIIGTRAFSGCTSLTNINQAIKNIEQIGSDAFYNCINIRQLSISGNPSILSDAFNMCNNLSKIYAPELTTLRGLPYIKDAVFGNIVSIYQILSNQYFYPILDISTVEYVASDANLNILKVIRLENCTSFNVKGNIGNTNVEEVLLPKWSCDDPHFNKSNTNAWSVYGFAGAKTYYGSNYYWYSNLKLSKLFLTYNTLTSPDSTIYNYINFPLFTSNYSSTASNIALYSCIEELGLYDFSHFTSRFEGWSPKRSPQINNFIKLKSIHTTNFSISEASFFASSMHGVKLSTLTDIYYDLNSEYGLFSIHTFRYDTYPELINIHAMNLLKFNIRLYEYPNNINIDNVQNIDELTFNILSCPNISEIILSQVSNVVLEGLYYVQTAGGYKCFQNLPNLNTILFYDTEKITGSNIYFNGGKGPFYEVSSLSYIQMPKLKYIDDFYSGIFESCGHINELYLPELIGYSTDFSVSESIYRGFKCPYTTFDKVTLGISQIHSKNCYMFNTSELYLPKCSKIEIITGGYATHLYQTHIGFDSNIKFINAPSCDDFVIDVGPSLDSRFSYYPINFHIESVILSEYVNNFKFIGTPHLSTVNVKTSGSYDMQGPVFGACYSLKDIYIQAEHDIILPSGTGSPVFPSLYYSDISSYYHNINNISITAGNIISIHHDPFAQYTTSAQIKYMILSADNIFLSMNSFVITDMLSISANSISINGNLIAPYTKFIGKNNGLIILNTPTFISVPFFIPSYSSQYSQYNTIIKVRQSLVSLYKENSEWQKFPNLQFIEI